MGCFQNKNTKIIETQRKIEQIKIKPGMFVQEKGDFFDTEYDLGEKLGSGAFSSVYKCKEKATGTTKAVKIVLKQRLSDQHTNKLNKLQELQVLKLLDHPNILKVYKGFEDSKNFYVITEYCEGGELFKNLMKRRHFTENEAAKIMYQLLSAISYCHSKNVVHRDLKPENLLIEGDAEELIIKVGDFGNSVIFDLKNKISGIFGSLYYMAPEVLDNNYNEKCDEWSCGIILFLLLTGKPPFRGKKTSELVNNIKYAKVITESQDFSAISQEAKDLIHRLMDRNLSKRISASEALSHAWLNKFLNPENPPTALLESVLSNLSLFTNTIKLKNAIFTYVATQCMSQAELKELNSAFKQLDKNSDGKLSKEELFAVYKQKFEGKTSEKEVENIMKNVDTDKSGFIDYTEFIQASLNQKIMFSKSNLEQAFRTFDIDGNGIITASEIAEIFSHDFIGEDAVWQGVLNQVDKNGDGNIDLKEFESILFDRYNSIQE